MPVFLGYDQAERMIAALLDRAVQWQPDVVVGIARGGLVPATMAAGILALPLTMIGFERAAGTAAWIGDLFWKGGDQKIIDGFGPDGVSALSYETGKRTGRLQTGYVYHYAFVMLVGVVALLSYALWFFSRGGR